LTSFWACILNISEIKKADCLIQNRGRYDEKLVGLATEMVIFGDIHPSGVLCLHFLRLHFFLIPGNILHMDRARCILDIMFTKRNL
jgi:hypothetical protein